MTASSELLLRWIRVAQTRANHELTKTLWFARDMLDGITAFDDPQKVEEMKPRIKAAFDAMNQDNEELMRIRKELQL